MSTQAWIIVVVVALPVLVLLGRVMVHGRATDASAAPMGAEPPHPVAGP